MTEWIEVTTEDGPNGGATKRVPKAWDEHNQRAKHALQTLRDQFGEKSGFTGSGLETGEQAIAGYTVFQPVVHVEDDLAAEIPDEIDGVSVRIEPPKGEGVGLDSFFTS